MGGGGWVVGLGFMVVVGALVGRVDGVGSVSLLVGGFAWSLAIG